MLILLAMLIGLVAGLRTMTAPAAVSWGAYLGWFDISPSVLSGATVAATAGMVVPGLLAGGIGAVVGTFGGASGRAYLARHFGRDLPAALIEDALAILLALIVVVSVS